MPRLRLGPFHVPEFKSWQFQDTQSTTRQVQWYILLYLHHHHLLLIRQFHTSFRKGYRRHVHLPWPLDSLASSKSQSAALSNHTSRLVPPAFDTIPSHGSPEASRPDAENTRRRNYATTVGGTSTTYKSCQRQCRVPRQVAEPA